MLGLSHDKSNQHIFKTKNFSKSVALHLHFETLEAQLHMHNTNVSSVVKWSLMQKMLQHIFYALENKFQIKANVITENPQIQ